MSGSVLREHSYLKVLYDFEYKTAEGREIIIKKNERLYLVQKTNDDWWQVVRNLEQRSFYVPATYVREVSKNYSSTRKNSEEEGIFEPPQDPSYKSMPKESSNAMRNVKKWLAGAMDGKSEPSKPPYDSEGAIGGKLKVNLDSKSKSLERDKRSEHYSDRDDEAANGSPRSRDSVELSENSKIAINRFGTSPKNISTQFRIDASIQDPFRRELESSLDRRNLSGKTGGKIGTRIRTKSTNSDGSFAESDDFHRENVEKIDEENLSQRRNDFLHRDESLLTNRESLSSSETSSKSFDFEGNHKFTERNFSPKNSYGRQMTIAGGTCVFPEKTKEISSGETSADHKILTDKRRTWAVEELMSELTQMCKERVTKKKPEFQLKSTELKSKFDPLEKLTREIHEMNRLRSEKNVENSSNSLESKNICKISINPTNSDEISEEIADKFTGKCLKSPKSPKILDEFNEANILNDCRTFGEFRDTEIRSLSPDKQSFYQKRLSSGKSSTENDSEAPCYSNVKLNADKVKLRAKLKIKMTEPCAELKLTPSLEKLASEIQFLPAKRTNQSPESISGISNEKPKENTLKTDENTIKSNESIDKIDCRKILKNFKQKLTYKGSFKTKREKKSDFWRKNEEIFQDPSENRGLKKSLSINCTKIPETVRKYRRDDFSSSIFEDFEEISTNFKRRSRSLTDLDSLEIDFSDIEAEKNIQEARKTRSRPVPLPRTIIPAIRGFSNEEMSKSGDKNRVERSESQRILAKTIPELRKTSRRENIHENSQFQKPETSKMSENRATFEKIVKTDQKSTKSEKTENSENIESFNEEKREFPQFFDSEKLKNRSIDAKIRRNVNIESSTAIGFKSLLCASDSGSDDNCLQSKDLLANSVENLNSVGSIKTARKLSSSANLIDSSRFGRESLSDEQILSSNASSEALQSQSESEATATLDISSHPSPINAKSDLFECAIDLPSGWNQKYDSDTGQICFVNEQGDKWFSSNDAEGKIYFFEENSNESSWVLPTVESEKSHSTVSEAKHDEKVDLDISGATSDKTESSGNTRSSIIGNQSVGNREFPTKKATPAAGDWPHLCDGNNMLVLKEGIINRTKITENGKKLRKNWSTSYAVLTELFLLFFKDAKTFAMMKTGQSSMAKPDISVDLNGALVEPGDRASSRKNVYMISTVLGLQVLVQSDNTALATEWFQEIHGAIRKLPSGFKFQGKALSAPNEIRKISGGKQTAEGNLLEDTKRFSKIARSRSMKMKRLDDSLEDLSGSAAERQTKIKAKLRRFFQRRPAVELLVKNGIYKDEPAFGSYLSDVCPTEAPRVPIFVKTCIEVLESKEENMKTDGLYRASGNLSQIQKIRLQVDQYKLDVLSQEEDVHVLAGALKLFFRELKEPLIPSTFFKEAVNASMLKKSSAKIQSFREIVKALPPPNYDTLQFLLKHLLRVTSYQEFNRMHIPNLAIVFGPTLMWPAEESANMALDFMQQNLVIECLLSEYNKIFK